MNRAAFHFYGSLSYFLPKKQRHKPIVREFNWRGSVKDMVESLNVPHPEIDLLVINDTSVDFDAIVGDGDAVHVYPAGNPALVENRTPLRPPLDGKPCFILDTHLGRLAAYLRMAGFDTLYRNDYPDDELAQVAHDERRVLLTRDIGLLKRSLVTYGYFVRETNPRRRLLEINDRFALSGHAESGGMGRCTRCNGELDAVDKADVRDTLRATTASYYDTFYQCQACEQVYWKGSHYERMQSLLDEVFNAAG